MAPSSRSPTPPSIKRLLQELKAHSEEPLFILQSLGPKSEAEILHWEAVMKGVPGTAYEGILSCYSCQIPTKDKSDLPLAGIWKLDIVVPPAYPLAPPAVKFMTPICHPNVHFKVHLLFPSDPRLQSPTQPCLSVTSFPQPLLTALQTDGRNLFRPT